MADIKKNVLFKQGLLANLPTDAASIIDGAIYMTTDERGIYLGHEGELKRMGDIIVDTYANIIKITNASQYALYYASDYNILMRHDGTKWVQINSQKSAEQLLKELNVAFNSNALKISIADHDGNTVVEDSVAFAGANGAKLTTNADGSLTVDATKYGIGTVANSNAGTIRLTGTGGNAAGTADVSISGTGLATVSSTAAGITVDVAKIASAETASATGNVATVTHNINDADGNQIATSNHTITGGGDITVTASGKNVTISGKDTVASLATAANGKIVLNNSLNGGSATSAGEITFKGNGSLAPAISTDGQNIVIKVDGPQVDASFDANGALNVALNDSDGNAIDTASVTPTVKIGKTEQSVKFVNGTADLNVYTITEVDNLLKGLDGMTFKGGVTAANVTTLKGVQNGDTYRITGAGTVNGQAVAVGDLIIYNGADTASTAAPVATNWTIIPSANEEVITYDLVASDGKVTLTDNGGNAAGQILEGTMIEVTSSSDGKTATISHANKTGITTTNVQAQSLNIFGTNSQSVTLMGNVTADEQGHVSAAQKGAVNFDPIKTVATKAVDVSTNATTGAATATLKVELKDVNGNGPAAANVTGAKITSSTLHMESTTDGMSLDLVWGSF